MPRDWGREPDDRNDDPGLHFGWDDTIYYVVRHDFVRAPAEHSLRVELSAEDGQRRGIHQSGVPIRRGFRIAAIFGSRRTGSPLVSMWLWRQITREADPMRLPRSKMFPRIGRNMNSHLHLPRAMRCKICGSIPGKGPTVGRPGVAIAQRCHRWRASRCFRKIKALRPAFIRWPGGNVAQDYHWMWGVGPRDQRFTWTNLFVGE